MRWAILVLWLTLSVVTLCSFASAQSTSEVPRTASQARLYRNLLALRARRHGSRRPISSVRLHALICRIAAAERELGILTAPGGTLAYAAPNLGSVYQVCVALEGAAASEHEGSPGRALAYLEAALHLAYLNDEDALERVRTAIVELLTRSPDACTSADFLAFGSSNALARAFLLLGDNAQIRRACPLQQSVSRSDQYEGNRAACFVLDTHETCARNLYDGPPGFCDSSATGTQVWAPDGTWYVVFAVQHCHQNPAGCEGMSVRSGCYDYYGSTVAYAVTADGVALAASAPYEYSASYGDFDYAPRFDARFRALFPPGVFHGREMALRDGALVPAAPH